MSVPRCLQSSALRMRPQSHLKPQKQYDKEWLNLDMLLNDVTLACMGPVVYGLQLYGAIYEHLVKEYADDPRSFMTQRLGWSPPEYSEDEDEGEEEEVDEQEEDEDENEEDEYTEDEEESSRSRWRWRWRSS